MAKRVVRATVWSAALSCVFAATCTIFVLDSLVQDHTDQRLRAATVTLGGELDEGRDEPGQDSMAETLNDENDEIVSSGIRLVVYEGAVAIAGDAWVPRVLPSSCETFGVLGERVRACGRAHGRWLLVAAQHSDQGELRWLLTLAGSGAVLVGVGIAVALSRRLSRWAVEPLVALANKVGRSDPALPNAEAFVSDSDCMEINAISQALQQLMTQVQALLEQARRLAADASHELRTPLAALTVQLELLSERRAGESAKPQLDLALSRARQLGVLVERLLLLAAPVDQLQGGFEAVALADVVYDYRAELAPEQRDRVQVNGEGEGLVRGDLALLRSLISNALGNALKYSAGPVRVQLAEPHGQHSVEVTIEDSGPGIAPELRQRVFEPFFRTAQGGGGHGLGLALVAHIAAAHAGSATFADAVQGARLVIRLPSWAPQPPRPMTGSGQG
jgi:signal transduction histidine kinase